MSNATQLITAIAATAILAAAAGYWFGTREPAATTAAVATPAPAAPAAQPATPAAHTAMADHPPLEPPPQSGSAHPGAGVDPNAKFTHFRVGQRNVKQIFADGKYMWVGTSGGVIRYDIGSDEYRLFDLRSGLLANGIFHIGKIGDRLAVGTYGGGLSLYDAANDAWVNYNIPQGLGDAFVYDVLETRAGDIWIATWSGANRVRNGALDDRDQWELHTVESTGGGLPNDWVYGLAEGKDGEVWMATEGGLARYKDGTWRNWNHQAGLGAPYATVQDQIQFTNDPAQYSQHHTRQKSEMGLENVDVAYNPNYIVALAVDADGTVWAGTWGGGLAHFDGTTWHNYTVADGLPANHVFSLHRDAAGRLWVGTSQGLALREGERFRVFTTEDGLFSNIVFSLATAPDASLWVGSFGGVARIARLP